MIITLYYLLCSEVLIQLFKENRRYCRNSHEILLSFKIDQQKKIAIQIKRFFFVCLGFYRYRKRSG
jgi:hypothetical protein